MALLKVISSLQRFESNLMGILGLRFPRDDFALDIIDGQNAHKQVRHDVLDKPDWLNDNILWAVPKKRRTILKRWCRRYGIKDYHWKLFTKKTNILMCVECGGPKEAGRLCATCYAKIKLETKEMQDAIEKELKWDPVESEVAVVYEGDRIERSNEFWKGKRIVEMKKERPPWFTKNLLQPTTQQPATTSDVKPTELA